MDADGTSVRENDADEDAEAGDDTDDGEVDGENGVHRESHTEVEELGCVELSV
jgi:hypothetical protein